MRFDYTPEDSKRFHRAIDEVAVQRSSVYPTAGANGWA